MLSRKGPWNTRSGDVGSILVCVLSPCADRKEFGYGFQELNKVRNDSREGFFFVAAEPTGQ